MNRAPQIFPCPILVLSLALLLAACSDDSAGSRDAGDGGSEKDSRAQDGAWADSAAGDQSLADSVLPRADSASPSSAACDPLPAPSGPVIQVTPDQAQDLPDIVASAAGGSTIVLADGVYTMSGNESQRRLTFATPNVTLRSASDQRDAVIIDGEYQTKEIVFIKAADVTIAHLTLRHAEDHLIHITGDPSGVNGTVLYDLHLEDGGEQFVKINSDGQGNYVDHGRLECSFLRMTDAGRPNVEPTPGGCYTGGIDGHGTWGWQVRLNTFEGIYCDNGSLAEHAVHFWSGSRDTLVERNRIYNCARGVGFGLAESGKERDYPDAPYPDVGYLGHVDGIIRNNVIHAAGDAAAYYDTGIELAQARGALVVHNTVVTSGVFSSIDYRFANTQVTIRNNLTDRITQRNEAQAEVDHNLQDTPLDLFVDWAARDYHLLAGASQAIDQGAELAEAGLDLDGKVHDHGLPDLGAYEYRP